MQHASLRTTSSRRWSWNSRRSLESWAAADRLDSLVELFAVGVQPRGTADPYALRRAAYGLVQIVIHHELDLDLKDAIGAAADLQPVDVSPQAREDVLDFILRRLEVCMRDAGLPPRPVAAAIGGERSSIAVKYRTAVELTELEPSNTFAAVLAGYNRAVRILPDKVPDVTVDESLFETPMRRASGGHISGQT